MAAAAICSLFLLFFFCLLSFPPLESSSSTTTTSCKLLQSSCSYKWPHRVNIKHFPPFCLLPPSFSLASHRTSAAADAANRILLCVEHKLCLSLFQAAEDDVAPCSHIAKLYCTKQNPVQCRFIQNTNHVRKTNNNKNILEWFCKYEVKCNQVVQDFLWSTTVRHYWESLSNRTQSSSIIQSWVICCQRRQWVMPSRMEDADTMKNLSLEQRTRSVSITSGNWSIYYSVVGVVDNETVLGM